MPEISFVYDRTQTDLEKASYLINKVKTEGFEHLTPIEAEEWNKGLKACRNASDLNRIENACSIIAEQLKSANILTSEITTKTNWTYSDVPSRSDIQNILSNVDILRSAILKYYHNIIRVPNNPINTIEKLNNIEKILYEVYNITNIILTDRQVCGESYLCNDDRLI